MHTSRFPNRLLFCLLVIALVAMTGIGMASAQTPNADCPSDTFLDVSAYQQQNYDNPELNVRCTEDVMIVESNGIVNYEFVPITPADLQTQNYAWQIPLNPEFAENPSGIPLLFAIGIAVNGLPIFGPNEAPFDDYGDPFLDQLLDFCNGHTAQGGVYHYHARPDCLFEDMEGNVSLVIGWSFDGFPILAPYACANTDCSEVVEVQSSYQRTQDVRNAWEAHEFIEGSGDLDVCNGMTLPDGSYAYYATDTFPYFLGCYVGTPLYGSNNNFNQYAPVGNEDYDFGNVNMGDQGQGGQNQGGQGNNPPPTPGGGQGGQGGNNPPPTPGNGGQGGNPPPPPPGGGQGGQNPPPPPGG